MTAPRFDESEWPLVMVTATPAMTPPESDAYFDRLRSLVERRLVFGMVFDSRLSPKSDAVERRKVADLMKGTAPLASKYCVGAAVVLASTVQRGILTGVLWLFTPPYPIQAVASVAEGRAWVLERLRLRREAGAAAAGRGPEAPRKGL